MKTVDDAAGSPLFTSFGNGNEERRGGETEWGSNRGGNSSTTETKNENKSQCFISSMRVACGRFEASWCSGEKMQFSAAILSRPRSKAEHSIMTVIVIVIERARMTATVCCKTGLFSFVCVVVGVVGVFSFLLQRQQSDSPGKVHRSSIMTEGRRGERQIKSG